MFATKMFGIHNNNEFHIMFCTEFMFVTNHQLFLIHCTEHKLRAEVRILRWIFLKSVANCKNELSEFLNLEIHDRHDQSEKLENEVSNDI